MKYKDINETFNSPHDFLRAVLGRKDNSGFAAVYGEKMPSKREGTSFSGTDNFEEASNLLLNGDKESAAKLLQEKAKIEKAYQMKRQTCRDYVGFLPCVPAYLSGQPRNMINIRKAPKQAPKILNISVNVAPDVSQEKRDIINAGAKILTAVSQLEANDYRCNIDIVLSQYVTGQKIVLKISLKKAGEPLNTLKLAYFLVNPSFTRRHLLRYIETVPAVLNEKFTRNYGYINVNKGILSICKMIKEETSLQDVISKILEANK